MPIEFLLQTFVFFIASVFILILIRVKIKGENNNKLLHGIIIICLCVSAFNYLNFAGWLSGKPNAGLHTHDMYHYYFGAKYYNELSHKRLYDCTVLGFEELKQRGVGTPDIKAIRDLSNARLNLLPKDITNRARRTCSKHFQKHRWDEFLHDLSIFLRINNEPDTWQGIFADNGNNPPPSWNVLARPIVNAFPLSEFSLRLLPMIDIILVIIISFVVFNHFESSVFYAFLLILFNNPLAPLGWTGGSYFRNAWFFALTLGVINLKQGKPGLGGGLLALATGLRVFPFLFWLIGFFGLMATHIKKDYSLRDYLLGSSIIWLLMLLCSVGMFSWEHWVDFYSLVGQRINALGSNNIGYDKVTLLYNVTHWPHFEGRSGLADLYDWIEFLKFDQLQVSFLRISTILSALFFCILLLLYSSLERSIVLGGVFCLYFLLMPFTYYYIVLALIPIALVSTNRQHYFAELAIFFLLMLVMMIFSVPFTKELGLSVSFFQISYWSSYAILMYLMAFSIYQSMAWHGKYSAIDTNIKTDFRLPIIALLLTAFLLVTVASIYTFRTRFHDKHLFLPVENTQIVADEGNVNAVMKSASNELHNENYVEFQLSGQHVSFSLVIPKITQGYHKVMMSYVASDLYSDFIVELGQNSVKVTMDDVDTGIRVPRIVNIGPLEMLNDSAIRIVPSSDTQESNLFLGLDGFEFLQQE